MDLTDARLIGLALSSVQVYALFFLLGSFTVASVSDVKHLAAQREFAEVWAVFAALLFILELWDLEFDVDGVFVVKWALILVLALLSLERVGILFQLAPADVLACVATASLLSPVLVLVFFGLLKVLSWPLAPVLARGRGHYPFLPVVTIATVGVLVLGFVIP